jgi:hypothetical protein
MYLESLFLIPGGIPRSSLAVLRKGRAGTLESPEMRNPVESFSTGRRIGLR